MNKLEKIHISTIFAKFYELLDCDETNRKCVTSKQIFSHELLKSLERDKMFTKYSIDIVRSELKRLDKIPFKQMPSVESHAGATEPSDKFSKDIEAGETQV